MSIYSKMTALADSIRAKCGVTGLLSIDGMKAAVDTPSVVNTSDATEVNANNVESGVSVYGLNGRTDGNLQVFSEIVGADTTLSEIEEEAVDSADNYEVVSELISSGTKPSDCGSVKYGSRTITDDGYFQISGSGTTWSGYHYMKNESGEVESGKVKSVYRYVFSGTSTNYYLDTLVRKEGVSNTIKVLKISSTASSPDEKAIIAPGAGITQKVPLSEFGDATAADVKEGVIFTSKDGIAQTGLMVESGGITPSGTKNITENGDYDVTSYATASVNINQTGITPSGTLSITANGDYNVTNYAAASVNIEQTGITPSGTKNITKNGVYDIAEYASVDVDVASATMSNTYSGDGSANDIKNFLYNLSNSGVLTAHFNGEYKNIDDKIPIPGGMSIVGGTFVADSAYADAIFSAQGDNVRLIGVTLKAPSHNKTPSIYTGNNVSTDAKASNVIGLFSNGHDGVALIDCVCDKIIPAKINNSIGIIRGCTITDTPMFVWATNATMHVSNNDVTICDTGLDKYYHCYYLDQNSVLYAHNNRIQCNTETPFADVYHLMTAGNDGTYRATGIVDGDVVIGNFHYIIDCHYADLNLNNCSIENTNTGEWYEFNNCNKCSYSYNGCTLKYSGAICRWLVSVPNTRVQYDKCELWTTDSLKHNSTFKDCTIHQTVNDKTIIGNSCDLYNCDIDVSGTSKGICVSTDTDLICSIIDNAITFASVNAYDFLIKCNTFTGCVCNNTFDGVLSGTKLWHSGNEKAPSGNNTINT